MRNASGYQKKQSEQEHKHSFLHKRVNRKLKEVSRFSRAKQRQGNAQESVLQVQSCFFAN